MSGAFDMVEKFLFYSSTGLSGRQSVVTLGDDMD
jgi:hypothetical protein